MVIRTVPCPSITEPSWPPEPGKSEITKQPPRLKNKNKGDTDSTKELGIHLSEQFFRDKRNISLVDTQIMTPTRPKNAIERSASTGFFLPENAYVRNTRMTEHTDTSVNHSLYCRCT